MKFLLIIHTIFIVLISASIQNLVFAEASGTIELMVTSSLSEQNRITNVSEVDAITRALKLFDPQPDDSVPSPEIIAQLDSEFTGESVGAVRTGSTANNNSGVGRGYSSGGRPSTPPMAY